MSISFQNIFATGLFNLYFSSIDPALQDNIQQVFTETWLWMQWFIVEDLGKLVELAAATIE